MAKTIRSLSLRRKEEEMADLEAKSEEITAWMESMLKEKLPKTGPEHTLRDTLTDGVVLCKLANAIKSGTVKKYHRRPRMLMMKIENIAFFLTACKTRFNIPQAVIFAPTDIHDDTDSTNMRKVVNVLLLLKNEIGGGPTAAEAAAALEAAERERERLIAEEEAFDTAEAVARGEPIPQFAPKKAASPPPPIVEPDTDHISDEEEEPEHIETEPKPKAVEVKPETKQSATSAPTNGSATGTSSHRTTSAPTNGSATDTSWYLQGRQPPHTDPQAEIMSEILSVIDAELSLESKLSLLLQLQAHMSAVQQKIMSASSDELRSLAHEMGLGNSLSDLPTSKDRQFYVDFITKHGRAQ